MPMRSRSGPGAVAPAKIVSSAGLLKFTDAVTDLPAPGGVPLVGYRGAILVGSTLYVAFNDTLVTVDEDGTVTKVPGDLPGTDRVQFSRNNRQPVPTWSSPRPTSSYLCSTSTITPFSPPGHVGNHQRLHGRLHVLCRRLRHDHRVADQ